MGHVILLEVPTFYTSTDNNENFQFKDLVKKTVAVLFMIPGACRKQALFTITVDKI